MYDQSLDFRLALQTHVMQVGFMPEPVRLYSVPTFITRESNMHWLQEKSNGA